MRGYGGMEFCFKNKFVRKNISLENQTKITTMEADRIASVEVVGFVRILSGVNSGIFKNSPMHVSSPHLYCGYR